MKIGPGVKRPANATQMFQKLMADAEQSDEGPQDVMKKRQRITIDSPQEKPKSKKTNARGKRKVVDSSSEESLSDKWSESEYNDGDDI